MTVNSRIIITRQTLENVFTLLLPAYEDALIPREHATGEFQELAFIRYNTTQMLDSFVIFLLLDIGFQVVKFRQFIDVGSRAKFKRRNLPPLDRPTRVPKRLHRPQQPIFF
jgi:hypothetical protein